LASTNIKFARIDFITGPSRNVQDLEIHVNWVSHPDFTVPPRGGKDVVQWIPVSQIREITASEIP